MPSVTGITHDSRAVRPGDVYAALPGARLHGADFVAQAADLGAAAILTDPSGAERAAATGLPVLVVENPRARMGALAVSIYGAPGEDLLQIGITGTSGKTTTAYLIEGGLRAAAAKRADGGLTGLIGTVETRIGDERIKSERTTPEATDLQALFAVMRERGVRAVAMEVSSHALVLGRVDGCVFDVAIFNNLSPEHMEFHSGMEDYFQAKAQLFTKARSRAGVVNLDDEYGKRLAEGESEVPVTTFSAEGHPDADWRASDVEVGTLGSTFTVHGPDGRDPARRLADRRPVQRRQRARRDRLAGRRRHRPADRGRRCRRGARRPRPPGAHRRRPALPGGRRLRPQDRRRRIGSARAAQGHRRQAARRPRLRRRPRPAQARPRWVPRWPGSPTRPS